MKSTKLKFAEKYRNLLLKDSISSDSSSMTEKEKEKDINDHSSVIYEDFGTPFQRGKDYFIFSKCVKDSHHVLYKTNVANGENESFEKEILNPNKFSNNISHFLSLESISFTEDGYFLAYTYSIIDPVAIGSDQTKPDFNRPQSDTYSSKSIKFITRIRNVSTCEDFKDMIITSFIPNIAWMKLSEGVYNNEITHSNYGFFYTCSVNCR
jgi:hypothetical protein